MHLELHHSDSSCGNYPKVLPNQISDNGVDGADEAAQTVEKHVALLQDS